MNARALLAQLASTGVTLQADGGRLKVKAPAALDAQVLAEVKAHKAALLQVLAGEKTHQNPLKPTRKAPASTGTVGAFSAHSTRKRVALPAPTSRQIEAMDADSYAAAEMLRRRLVSCGVTLKASRTAGRLRFSEPRLCIEWDGRISPDDWAQVLAARAELLHMIGPRAATVAEFDASAAYRSCVDRAANDEADTEEEEETL